MTPTEKLERIKAKCQWLVENSVDQPMAEAGWRATIAAVDILKALDGWNGIDMSGLDVTQNILAAWPEELL